MQAFEPHIGVIYRSHTAGDIMHIGLIGGIGPAATEFYYRNLVKRHKAAGKNMALTIMHADVETLVGNMMRGAKHAQADIFASYITSMKAAGCEAAAVTSMAGHFCIDELIAISPLPLINAIPTLDARLKADGVKTVGILGSGKVMKTAVYGGIPSINIVLPQGETLDRVSETYMTMARAGEATQAQRDFMFTVGRALHEEQGADVVLLGGTDLFLAFDGYEPGFPVMDAALVHVDALFDRSVNA